MAIESWRFLDAFIRLLREADAGRGERYMGQAKFFYDKLTENLAQAHVKLVDFRGQSYNSGLPVKALNLEEFDDDAPLIITQMLEPVIMGDEGILRQGTVIVERKQ